MRLRVPHQLASFLPALFRPSPMPRSRAVGRVAKLALALAALGAGGCKLELGDDYRVKVSWLINGTSPSPELCREKGVDRVRFTVETSGRDRVIEGNCEEQIRLDDGYYYGGFETTRSFDYGVRYRYRVEMLDADGNPLRDYGYSDTFWFDYGDGLPRELAPLELFEPKGRTAALFAEWTIDRRTPTQAECDRLNITDIAVDVASSTDGDFEDSIEIARAPCAEGVIDTVRGVLAEGEYLVRYVALDARDQVVDEIYFDEDIFQVKESGTLDIPIVDF
jgi:hypothetical protein